jgi:hypothetical protein
MGRPFPMGALIKSISSASLYTVKLLLEVVRNCNIGYEYRSLHRFAALAVSITLPPPTLHIISTMNNVLKPIMHNNVREKMTEVVIPGPLYSASPAFFSRLSDHLIVNLKWKVCLGLKRCQGLPSRSSEPQVSKSRRQDLQFSSGPI